MKITASHLRQIIREELIREIENPGGGMSVASQKGKINTATAELTKTYNWFKNTVFPAVEGNSWPIIADSDYVLKYGGDPRKGADPSKERIYIKKNTQFQSLTDVKTLGYGNGIVSNTRGDISQLYDILEDEVLTLNLPVPMESFPG